MLVDVLVQRLREIHKIGGLVSFAKGYILEIGRWRSRLWAKVRDNNTVGVEGQTLSWLSREDSGIEGNKRCFDVLTERCTLYA